MKTNQGSVKQISRDFHKAYERATNPDPLEEKRKSLLDQRKKKKDRLAKSIGL